jgi:nucleoside-diphosphate-sugar epimerase
MAKLATGSYREKVGMRILVTGAYGWTAVSIVQALKHADHQLIAFDRPTVMPHEPGQEWFTEIALGSVADIEAIRAAMQTADAVVHLAIAVGEHDYRTADIPFETNVTGTYNVFEAARQNGQTHRIILTGSAPVHLTYQPGETSSAEHDCRTSPNADHLYDLTQCLQEAIAKDFCSTYSMTAITLRLGHIVDSKTRTDPKGRSLTDLDYARGRWVCRYDVANAVLTALALPVTGYHAFNLVGARQARLLFDMERTERELGYRCQADFAEYE